jgi:N-methylhydantoinase A
MAKGGFSIGVDIGGTFTDVVLIEDDGSVQIAKGISTVAAYERGILHLVGRLLDELGLDAADCRNLFMELRWRPTPSSSARARAPG